MKPDEDKWKRMQSGIRRFLEEYLLIIEQRYGDCRSPFGWPPAFRLGRRLFRNPLYICELFVYDEGSFSITSERLEDLEEKVREAVVKRFGDVRPE